MSLFVMGATKPYPGQTNGPPSSWSHARPARRSSASHQWQKDCWFCLKNPNAAELSESATASNVLPNETTADRDGSEYTKTSVGVSLLRHHRAF